jgi:hypothetical protein
MGIIRRYVYAIAESEYIFRDTSFPGMRHQKRTHRINNRSEISATLRHEFKFTQIMSTWIIRIAGIILNTRLPAAIVQNPGRLNLDRSIRIGT